MSLTLGETLHNFRVDKNMTLKQVSSGIISSSFLSKVENGKSEISFDNLLKLIDRLNISCEELLSAMDGQTGLSSLKRGLSEITEALYTNNDKLLANLEVRYHRKCCYTDESSFLFLEIIARGYLGHLKGSFLTKKDAETVRIYLYSVKSWGEFELLVFGNCVITLPTITLVNLLDILSLRTNNYQKVNNNLVIGTLLNAANILIERGEKIPAQNILGRIEAFQISENDLLLRQQFLLLQGYFSINFSDVKSGIEKANKAIEIANILGAKHLVINDMETLKHYLSKLNKNN